MSAVKRALSLLAIAAMLLCADPWPASDLIAPNELAHHLSGATIIYVGFPALYRAAHIPGAVLEGPASKPDALEHLKQYAARLAKNQEIVLYCGCCPFAQCPNIRPAYSALHDMAFTNLKVLVLDHNFHTDWVSKGYPTEKGN